MFRSRYCLAILACGSLLLAGCASVGVERSRSEVNAWLAPRLGAASAVQGAADPAQRAAQLQTWLAQPLDADTALRIALLRNPQIQIEYARLGLVAADVFEAQRLSNPSLSLSVLGGGASGRKVEAGLALGFTDLLWLPARRRLAARQQVIEQQRVAAAILDLALNVQAAWIEAVSAAQQLAIRDGIVAAAQTGSDLAQSYRNAGNIDALALLTRQIALSEAQLAQQRASSELAAARARLQQLMGLDATQSWTLREGLPDLDATLPDFTAWREQAQQRSDLQAARQEVEALRAQLRSTQRLRAVGASSVGVQSERENGVTRTGPSISLALPLFQQGQGAVLRAQSELQQGEARAQQLGEQIDAQLQTQLQRMQSAQQQFALYRGTLIPLHEQLVARLAEQQNFMLIGPFEGMVARQQQYEAYEGAIDAARSYWLARIELSRLGGAALPALRSPADSNDEVQP
ncbi:MAG: TolC family protein [Steroidobacteraceae bacterium]